MTLYRGIGTTDTTGAVGATQSEEVQTATASQTVFTLTTISFQPGEGNLVIYINGVRQETSAYTEGSDGVTVTFSAGLEVGDTVAFVSGEILSSISGSNATNITYNPVGGTATTVHEELADLRVYTPTGGTATTIAAKLAETVSVLDFGATGDGSTDDTAAIQDAIEYVSGLVTGGGEVIFPAGVYLHDTGFTVEASIITLRFLQGSRLKATAAMNYQIAIGDGVNRKEEIIIIDPYLDGNSLANFGIGDLGTRISGVFGGYFKNHIEYHVLQEPTTADYSEFFFVKRCQGFDAKGLYKHLATSIGRATDTIIEDNVMFRPTLWLASITSGQRFKIQRNMVGSQTAAYSGGVFITASDSHTLTHTAEHIITDLYVESNSTYGTGMEAVVIENQSTTQSVTGCVIDNVRVEPSSKVAIARISNPAAGGSRQHTITGIDPKGGFSSSITIGSNVAYTRISSKNADANLDAYIADSGTYTVINKQLQQAAGKDNPVTTGAVGDIIRNTSNDSLWTRDHDGNYIQVGHGTIVHSETIDIASVASGGTISVVVATISGVTLGDYAQVSFATNVSGLLVTADCRTGQVEVKFYNPTGGAIDLPSTTMRILVTKH